MFSHALCYQKRDGTVRFSKKTKKKRNRDENRGFFRPFSFLEWRNRFLQNYSFPTTVLAETFCGFLKTWTVADHFLCELVTWKLVGGKFDELNAELIDSMETSSMEYYGRKLSLCRPSQLLSLLKLLCLCCECLFMPLIRGVCSCAGCCEKLRTLRQRKWSH